MSYTKTTPIKTSLPSAFNQVDPIKQTDLILTNSQKGGKKGMSSRTQSIFGSIGSIFGNASGTEMPSEDKALREGIRSTIAQFGPWGAAIAAASGVVDAIGEWTNTNLDTIDKNVAERTGTKAGATFNKIANILPGNSMLWGLMGGNTSTANMSADATLGASGFSGSWQKLLDAQQLSNKRMLVQKGVANSFIHDANRANDILTDLSLDAKKHVNNYAGQLIGTNYAMDVQGYKPSLSFRKHGGTIPELEEARISILSLQSKNQEKFSETQKFQLGGKMNMIVTGALHARKHNLEELNPNLEGEITKKGIPVVIMNEGGEVQSQQAEVETGEIIMQIDATKTIEDYYDAYNSTNSKTEKNKIALECGKYLVDELLKNTDDPDKLIKKTV